VLSGGDQFVTKLFALIGGEDRHAGILMDRLHGGAKIPTSPKTGEKWDTRTRTRERRAPRSTKKKR